MEPDTLPEGVESLNLGTRERDKGLQAIISDQDSAKLAPEAQVAIVDELQTYFHELFVAADKEARFHTRDRQYQITGKDVYRAAQKVRMDSILKAKRPGEYARQLAMLPMGASLPLALVADWPILGFVLLAVGTAVYLVAVSSESSR